MLPGDLHVDVEQEEKDWSFQMLKILIKKPTCFAEDIMFCSKIDFLHKCMDVCKALKNGLKPKIDKFHEIYY
jgi:hypothetical protein